MQLPRSSVGDGGDGFISWLRGEFAVANGIIDSLCHHLISIGEPGEYDSVFNCIHQHRYNCNWNSILYMQPYYPVPQLPLELHLTQWRRHQRRHFVEDVSVQSVLNPVSNKDEEKPEKIDENGSENLEEKEGSDDGVKKSHVDINVNVSLWIRSPEGMKNEISELEVLDGGGGCTSNSTGTSDALQKNDAGRIPNQDEEQNPTPIPKTFVANEIFSGIPVNVVEGLELYEEIFDSSKISKIVSLVNELRATGQRGHLQGPTFVVTKTPMKGRGREIIQLGLPIANAPPEDQKVEAIPGLLQDVIDRLVSLQVVNVKPDSCIVDFFNKGDHSQPFICPYCFGRPLCILFLTECEMTFGRVIGIDKDNPGKYRGCLELSPTAGSLLTMQGRSADFSKYAIPSLRKQRILVTFTKFQSEKTTPSVSFLNNSSTSRPLSPWGPSTSRPLNHVCHPAGPKNYGTMPTTGVLPAPAIHPQHLPPPNGMQPLFVPAPVAPALPYPAPVPLPPASPGWAAVPPRHPPPRLTVPGTRVFLPPPGSSQSPPLQGTQQQTPETATEVNFAVETPSPQENDFDRSNSNCCASPEGKLEEKVQTSDVGMQ